MKSLKRLARAQKWRYFMLVSCAVAIGFIVIAQAYVIVSIVEDIFLDKKEFKQVTALLVILLGVLLLRSLLSYGVRHIGIKMAAVVKADYRKRLLQAYSGQSLLAGNRVQSGKKVSVMMDAVDELDGFYSSYIPQRIVSTAVSLIILMAIFSLHIYSGIIILVTAPLIPVFMIMIGKTTQKKSEEKLDSLSAFSGRFLDTLQGLVSLKLYGTASRYQTIIRTSSFDFRDTTMAILKIAFTSSLMLEFISMLSIGLVALELGFRLVIYQEVTFFTAFFILLLIPEFYHLLKELGSAFHSGRSSIGAASKIDEVLEQKYHLLEWGEDSIENGGIVKIELENIVFSYGSTGFKLTNINAIIPTTGHVAIVGKSGSGKSTLLYLLAGLLKESSGDLTVNGKSRSEYQENNWFSMVTYITQDPYLFSGTFAENISLGLDATIEDIFEAAGKANISDFIASLPNGYETIIGEGGRVLSGGEKQRVALARAFLRKSSVILFDEPTSGLDLLTEQVLKQSIKELAKESIVITVAHRLQTIKEASHVMFLEDGTIKAQGTHYQLYQSIPAYRQLFFGQREGKV